LRNDRLKRTRAACSAWTSKMKVAQNERTRHRRRRVRLVTCRRHDGETRREESRRVEKRQRDETTRQNNTT
jgi:hypothetical protein